MGFVRLCIKHPVTVVVVFILAVVMGWFSLSRLPIDLFPEIEWPVLVVRITYSGVAPQEMETLVTEKVEEALASVEDMKKITSQTSEGLSLVILEFQYGTDIDFASLHVRDKLDQIGPSLPDDADDPVIQKFDPAAQPVLDIQVSGTDLRAVRKYVDDVVKPKLERVNDVAAAVVDGGLEREIRVPVSAVKLAARNLVITDIVDAVDRENVNEPGGRIDEGRREITVRTLGEYENVDEIGEVLVAHIDEADVKVKDLTDGGRVLDTHKEVRSLNRLNLQPSVSVNVMKQSGTNSVAIADGVKVALEELKKELPSGYDARVGTDMTTFIKDSISVVKQNAVGGAVLAALVLLLFLRSIRSTAVILVAIPVSILTSFFPMYFLNMTLNLITLGGLALGVGMVVDNSIVVLESAFRHIRRTGDRAEGALTGTVEVMLAIVASTLTTLAVFFPVLFIKGLVGQIFSNLAFVIIFSLSASLVVGVMLVPVLCAKLLHPGAGDPGSERVGGLWGALLARYERALRWATGSGRNRWIVVGAVLALFFVTLKFLAPAKAFFPEMDQGVFNISLTLPVGSTLDHTDELSLQAEKILLKIPEVDRLTAGVSPASSNISVTLVDLKKRSRTTKQVGADARDLLVGLPDCEVRVSEPKHGGGGGPSFSIEVKGDAPAVLERLCKEMESRVQGISGLADLRTSFEEGRPELQLVVDRDRAADLGVSVKDISDVVQAAVGGKVASYYRESGKEYDIRVQFAQEEREVLDDLEQIYVRARGDRLVPLSSVVREVPTKGPVTIYRKEQQRLGYVWGEPDLDKLGEVVTEAKERLADLRLPEGYSYAFGGEEEEMTEAFSQLGAALVFAVFLVYLILAAQFESFAQPLLIMTTVPVSVVGVFMALKFSGLALSLPANVGIIMLAGIVVNNAILLVDYANTLRGRGVSVKEAVVEAGLVRIRPVLMTSGTTVLGLLPLGLGIGSGSRFLQPLAMAVMGGLTVATFVTLILIPAGYVALDAGLARLLRFFARLWR